MWGIDQTCASSKVEPEFDAAEVDHAVRILPCGVLKRYLSQF